MFVSKKTKQQIFLEKHAFFLFIHKHIYNTDINKIKKTKTNIYIYIYIYYIYI